VHNTTGYIIKFTVVLTVLAGLALSGMFYATEPAAKRNEEVFKKRAILSSIAPYLDKPLAQMSDDEVLQIFKDKIEQHVVNTKGEVIDGAIAEKISMKAESKKKESDMELPIFTYKGKDGDINILSIYGNGLWDKIWGYIALKDDNKTIVGAAFDHAGETPGLGAEIKDNPSFAAEFIGKTIFDGDKYTSVKVLKKVTDPAHQVDGIGGATLTSNGVSEMMVRGIKYYLPYLQKHKK